MQYTILLEDAAEVIGAEGGIQDILAAMRAFPKELELASNCCIALWSLSVVGMSITLHIYMCNNYIDIKFRFRYTL